MNEEYIGKICPYCKSEFKENDDIVVCDSCEMPHHKDCWIENQGCTTFGCTGTIKGINENNFYEQPDCIYCTKCGAENAKDSKFCGKCGNCLMLTDSNNISENINNQQQYNNNQQFNQQAYGYTQHNAQTFNNAQYKGGYANQQQPIDQELLDLINVKQEYYTSQFFNLTTQNKKNSWNWASFLAGPYWLIYRKMYLYGLGLLIIMSVVSVIPVIGSIAGLALWICMGIFGNYIYKTHLDKLLSYAKAMNVPEKNSFIQEYGGVDSRVVGVLIGVTIVAAVVFTSVLGIVGSSWMY